MPSTPGRESLLQVGEVQIRVRVEGVGRPLLVITGLGASLDLAAPFHRELAVRGHQVISFDAPGVGGSSAYRRPRRMAGLAGTATAILDALDIPCADVLGLSLGGLVAQQLARQAPARVDKLVLAATLPGVGGVPGSPTAVLPLITPRRYGDPSYYRRVAGRIYGGSARTDPAALIRAMGRIRPPSVAGYLGQLWAVAGWTSLPWLHTIHAPTLVLAGDDDPLVPLVNGRLLAWRIPGARLHVVRGGGHLFVLEQPAEAAQLVSQFLHGSARP